jgi:hypothetical protein
MKALYLDDSVTTCECCGRTELKATVAMELSDGGILHYGRTCAARNSGKTGQQITKPTNAPRTGHGSRPLWQPPDRPAPFWRKDHPRRGARGSRSIPGC